MHRILQDYGTIMAFTGHRPDKLGVNEWHSSPKPGSKSERIWDLFREQFETYEVNAGISGMALGTDMVAADAILAAGLSLFAAIPLKGQDRMWPAASKERYLGLLRCAVAIYVVDIQRWVTFREFQELPITLYSGGKMHKRNQWMVENSHMLSAIFNGSPGGTAACLDYAYKWNLQHPEYQICVNNPQIL